MLHVNQLTQNTGFTTIKTNPVQIINETVTVLHLIDINEIQSVMTALESDATKVNFINKGLVFKEIQLLKSKLKSIIPAGQIRHKRGLINLGGTLQRWLFGTMDDDDRIDITEHLDIITKNVHNTIDTINKQNITNEHCSDSIKLLKATILSDRKNRRSLQRIKIHKLYNSKSLLFFRNND